MTTIDAGALARAGRATRSVGSTANTQAEAEPPAKRPSLFRIAGTAAGTIVGGTAGYLAGGPGARGLAGAVAGAAVGGAVGYNIGNGYSAIGMGTRHLIDSTAFGVASDRWDMRNSYRTDYSEAQRFGAELFDAGTVALAGFGAVKILKNAPQLMGGGVKGVVGVAAGLAATGAIGFAAANKVKGHMADRGDLRPLLAAGGLAVGAGIATVLGGRGGRMASAMSVVGASAAGLAAGAVIGSKIKTGESQLGVDKPKIHIPAESLPGKTGEFGRAALVQFVDSGPPTQGLSFGSWGAREHFERNYSRPEQAGGMAGNAVAAAVHVGGALAVVKALGAAGGSDAALKALGPISRRIAPRAEQLLSHPGAKGGAAVIAGLVAAHEIARARSEGASTAEGLVNAGVTLGLGALGTVAARAGGIRPANAMMTGVALASAISLARTPVESFINQSRTVWGQTDKGDAKVAAGIAGSVLGAGGVMLGAKVGGGVAGGRLVGKVIGGVVGGAVGALAGIGAAPVMPFVDKADQATLPVEPPADEAPADDTLPDIGTPVVDEDGDGVPDDMAAIDAP